MCTNVPAKIKVSNVSPDTLYDLHSRIGRGSFGEVFKAIDKRTREVVAVKVIFLEAAEDEIEDIQQEIAVLSQCNNPQIIKYFGSYLKDTSLWIIMEYLGGGSALDLLKPGPIPEQYIPTILREILKGLEYLHGQKMIHRDIKAANVLFSYSGDVKLADFGVSGQLSATFNKRCSFVGTPCWMAPELIQRCDYDSRVDIWSMGITAIELAKGVPPNADLHPVRALMFIPRNPPPKLTGNFSPAFKEFVECCLIKIPEHRSAAHELLRMPFIKKAQKNSSLQDLIERYRHWSASGGAGSDEDDDDDDDCVSPDGTIHGDRGGRHKTGVKNASPTESLKWVFDTIRASPSTPVTAPVSGIDSGTDRQQQHQQQQPPNLHRGVSQTQQHQVDSHLPIHPQPAGILVAPVRIDAPAPVVMAVALPPRSIPIVASRAPGHHQPSPQQQATGQGQQQHIPRISLIDASAPTSQEVQPGQQVQQQQLSKPFPGPPTGAVRHLGTDQTGAAGRMSSSPVSVFVLPPAGQQQQQHYHHHQQPQHQQQAYLAGSPSANMNNNNNLSRVSVITYPERVSEGQQQQQLSPNASSPAFRLRVLPLLTELRSVYRQVRENAIDPIDQLISVFQAVDSTSPEYMTKFLVELLVRTFECNPRLSTSVKQRALTALQSNNPS